MKSLVTKSLNWFDKVFSCRFLYKLLFFSGCMFLTAIIFEVHPNACKSTIWITGWIEALIFIAVFKR